MVKGFKNKHIAECHSFHSKLTLHWVALHLSLNGPYLVAVVVVVVVVRNHRLLGFARLKFLCVHKCI